MALSNIAPPPYQTSLVEPQGLGTRTPAYIMTAVWVQWFLTALLTRVQASPQLLPSVQLENQSASIATTPIPTESLSAGLYRISYYARITAAAVTNSSLTIALNWIDGGVTQTFTGTAMTGNTTTTYQAAVFPFRIDRATAISYATTYASNGPGQMHYSLDIALEAIGS